MFFKQFVSRLMPSVKADEDELVDPQQTLRDKCREKEHARHLVQRYEECNNRVSSKSRTTETCLEELFDLLHAVDHCVAPELFSKLK